MPNPVRDDVERYLHDLRQVVARSTREAVMVAVATDIGAPIDKELLAEPVLPVLPVPPGLGPDIEAADLLGLAVQAVTAADERHAEGMYFTPRPVAEAITAVALSDGPEDWGSAPSHEYILDPTCGGGAFLLAAARWLAEQGLSRAAAVAKLRGVDLDPLAAATARMALGSWADVDPDNVNVRAGNGFFIDELFADHARSEKVIYTAIIGNPPFQNQLGETTARSAEDTKALRSRFDRARENQATSYTGKQIVRPYTDTAALFLLDAHDRLADGGVAMMILPQSILATNDTQPIREIVSADSALEALWIADDAGFDASVRVCAPKLRKGGRQQSVARYISSIPVFDHVVPPASPPSQWSEFAADRLGVPRVKVSSSQTVADLAGATAGFRDEYYGLARVAQEAQEAQKTATEQTAPEKHHGPPVRLITSGLIEPLDCRWGIDSCRFAKQRWEQPSIDLTALADDGRVFGWVEARRVPKLLVATQTKVIEAIADPDGNMVPVTPVLSVEPENVESLWHLAAVLTNPVTSAVALRRTAGAALAANAIKLSAKQLLALPVPNGGAAWDRGASLAKELASSSHLTAPSDRDTLLVELGAVMCDAYQVAPDELLDWWTDRLAIDSPVVRAVRSRGKIESDG